MIKKIPWQVWLFFTVAGFAVSNPTYAIVLFGVYVVIVITAILKARDEDKKKAAMQAELRRTLDKSDTAH